jgi:hypothetical protein
MVNFKTMNVSALLNMTVLGLILLIAVGVIITVVGPILSIILPHVFGTGINLTDTLLLLILVRLHWS